MMMSEVRKKGKVSKIPLAQIPRSPSLFPHRIKKKIKYGRFSKFIAMPMQLSVNVTLVEALEKRLGYAKFRKELVTKKTTMRYELMDNLHQCSAIIRDRWSKKI